MKVELLGLDINETFNIFIWYKVTPTIQHYSIVSLQIVSDTKYYEQFSDHKPWLQCFVMDWKILHVNLS
jgi:hypothetical protein